MGVDKMKKKNKFVLIKCTEKQAILIETALDTLSRMTTGQLHTIIDGIMSMKGKWIEVDSSKNNTLSKMANALSNLADDSGKMAGYRLGSHIEKLLKPLLFPELPENASYGVGNKEIGDGQIAYEMVKILQNFRSKKHKKDCYCVLHHEPLHYSKEPLIEIKDIK